MTDEVAGLVLRNNYLQTLALSLAERRGPADLGFAQRLMQTLERQGRLDRAVEFLPDDAALAERGARGEALTRPELAVLLAYAKLDAARRSFSTARVPDDPYLRARTGALFPGRHARALPGRDRGAPAAARDHRDAARQRHRQPRRADARDPPASTRPAPTRRPSPRPMRRPATRSA